MRPVQTPRHGRTPGPVGLPDDPFADFLAAVRGLVMPAPTNRPRCGTYRGANEHKRAGEWLCDDCNDAAATYQALRRRRIALGLPVQGHDANGETPRWFEIAGDMATVGATIRRAFIEGA